MHLLRERSRELVKEKPDAVLPETGGLACEARGFDLNDGSLAAHALKPM
jgi:hypothetical protein